MGWRFLVLASLLLACTKQNPKSCRDGVCNDPSLPYCDVGGELSGTPFTCVAGDCTAGTFAACRGDTAITCNAAGTSFDDVQCELGCDAASGGCRLCNPNETACTNGTLATCDAAGKVVSSEKCALGCFEDQPRCRDIDPSNGLGQYLDMVVDPPDLVAADVQLNTDTGDLFIGGQKQSIPTFLAPAPGNGAPIRVYVTNRTTITGHVIVAGKAALAIVARGEITFDGRLTINEAGSLDVTSCRGGPSFEFHINGPPEQFLTGGSGGGGHATAGGDGGAVTPLVEAGVGGQPSGNEKLVPLRGGCPSGGFPPDGPGAFGGGAVQLTSAKAITVSGIVDARGQPGFPEQGNFNVVVYGGGAGGGILLEAPTVTLQPTAKLLAKGGAGGANTSSGGTTPSTEDAAPDVGARCVPSSQFCTDGGNGAAPNAAAGSSADVAHTGTTSIYSAGGGGGGLGRLRINTADGTYTNSNTTIEAAATTSGVVTTR